MIEPQPKSLPMAHHLPVWGVLKALTADVQTLHYDQGVALGPFFNGNNKFRRGHNPPPPHHTRPRELKRRGGLCRTALSINNGEKE